MTPSVDMRGHWEASSHAIHPLHQRPPLEPALEVTLNRLSSFEPSALDNFRSQVIADIKQRRIEMQPLTQTWFRSLPDHIQKAYTLPAGDIVQVPLFISLLRGAGYEDADALEEALSSGFPVVGPLEPSPGWRPRLDDRYDNPISEAAFDSLNHSYVCEKLARGRVDPEWDSMLQEILQEVRMGRMSGPYGTPQDWPRQCVPVASHLGFARCLPLQGKVRVAAAFSVVQAGSDGARKVRRCEDYRRSGHNAKISVRDIPAHDDIGKYVHILLRLHRAGFGSMVWCLGWLGAWWCLCVLLALVSDCVQRSRGAFVRECVCKASGLGLFGRLRGGLRRLQGSASASVCARKVSGVGLLCRLRRRFAEAAR